MEDTRYVGGAQKLGRRIATIRAALSLPALTAEIGTLLERRAKRRFDTETDPDGRPWTSLAEVTLERRKRAGGRPGRKILTQSGGLKQSVKMIRGAALGQLAVNTGAGVRIGIEGDTAAQEKARAHNYGVKSRNLPIRRILGIGPNDIRAVDALMRRTANKLES